MQESISQIRVNRRRKKIQELFIQFNNRAI